MVPWWLGRLFEGLGKDFVATGVAPGGESFGECGVGCGEGRDGEECGVGGASGSDGKGGDGDALGHLDDGEEGVDALKRGRGDGDAEDGDDRLGGEHSGKVRRASGSGDDDAEAAGVRLFGVLEEQVGGAMGGDDAGFVGDVEGAEHLDCGLHDGEVVLAAHNDADERGDAGAHREIIRF